MVYKFNSESEIKDFIKELKLQLLEELPGVNAHLLLAPQMRIKDLKSGNTPTGALESAVLFILYPIENKLFTAVILRNEYDGAHSGQISLPGGKRENSDKDLQQTALREAREEIGIIPEKLEIIGQLSRFYVRPSNFVIYPFIAFQTERPIFHPDPTEVQRIIEIDIFEEMNFDKIVNKTLTFKNNIKVDAPGFVVGNEFLWGATAMIFSELLHVLNAVITKSGQNIVS
jgi:8-oxo-dGTP pyrophosphatase MutT (NUDIX family)